MNYLLSCTTSSAQNYKFCRKTALISNRARTRCGRSNLQWWSPAVCLKMRFGATHPAFACARSTFYPSDQIVRMPIQPTNLFGRNLTLFWLYVPLIYSEATCEDQYIISLNWYISLLSSSTTRLQSRNDGACITRIIRLINRTSEPNDSFDHRLIIAPFVPNCKSL